MEDKVINLNEQLNGIEKLFASGQIKKAQKDLRKLNSQFGREKPIPQKFRHKFQRLNFTAKEYDDWAEFATSDKRTELIQEVSNLATSKLEPRRLAEKIHSVQRQWQNLDQHGKTASKEKWSTFKEACEKAWLPCREYFEVLDSKKDENKLKKLQLINQIESFPIGKSPEQITVIQIVNFLKSMHAKWKDCSPVPDADFQELNKKFRDSREGVNELLLSVEQYNKSLKEEIISEVEALDFDDLDNSVLKIKELQEKWRTLGPAGKKLDPEINKNFDLACSKFLLEKDKELDESRGILETIIKDVRDESISTSEAEEKFKELTNCPTLINTSFNVRGEPMVCTPQDAYRCFMRTEIDILVLQNQILYKEKQINIKMNETKSQSNKKVTKTWKIPACYDEDFALDIKIIQKLHKISKEEVINLHSSVNY